MTRNFDLQVNSLSVNTQDESKYFELVSIKEQIENYLDHAFTGDGSVEELSSVESPEDSSPEQDRAPRLAVVVGHTQNAPGARGVAPINQHEYAWNSDLAQRIATMAQQRGALCRVFFRDGIGIAGAYAQVAAWRADAAIELHFNAFNGQARGTETLHGTSTRSRQWAQMVHDALISVYQRTGSQNRGLKRCPPHPRGGSSVNALPNVPTCLSEPFFGDNSADAALGQRKKSDQAQAIVEAFLRFAPAPEAAFSSEEGVLAAEGAAGLEAQRCSSGWRITGYYTPHEEDFGGPQVNVPVNGSTVTVRRSFRDEVKMEGWGKTREGWYLGYYNSAWHRDTHPRDSRGNKLDGPKVAVDPARIPFGAKVTLPDATAPFNSEAYIASDVGGAINGRHIDVYCGEGRHARDRTYAVTGSQKVVCIG